MTIITTDRMRLRQFTLNDAPFVLELVNQPSWITNIGDKNVHSIEAAENYLQNGPLQSYGENGFGLLLAELKVNAQPIGMCGLIKRDDFQDPDVGFAFMPDYWGLGLASEAAKATMHYASHTLKLNRVVGVTSMDNVGSIRVLEKSGLKFDKVIEMSGYSEPSRFFIPK